MPKPIAYILVFLINFLGFFTASFAVFTSILLFVKVLTLTNVFIVIYGIFSSLLIFILGISILICIIKYRIDIDKFYTQ